MSESALDKPLYRFGWRLCRFIFFTLRRIKIEGAENIPGDGAFIAAPNHSSYIDPPLVGASCKRALSYMAKKELFSVPLLGWILPRINVFPVERGTSDVGAVRAASAILAQGRPLLIFPEGTRGKRLRAGGKKPPKLGVGYFASKARVPVLPVYVSNTDSFFSLKPIKIVWGAPVPPPENPSKDDYALLTEKVIREIYRLAEKP